VDCPARQEGVGGEEVVRRGRGRVGRGGGWAGSWRRSVQGPRLPDIHFMSAALSETPRFDLIMSTCPRDHFPLGR